jgi:hypothetical protein
MKEAETAFETFNKNEMMQNKGRPRLRRMGDVGEQKL